LESCHGIPEELFITAIGKLNIKCEFLAGGSHVLSHLHPEPMNGFRTCFTLDILLSNQTNVKMTIWVMILGPYLQPQFYSQIHPQGKDYLDQELLRRLTESQVLKLSLLPSFVKRSIDEFRSK